MAAKNRKESKVAGKIKELVHAGSLSEAVRYGTENLRRFAEDPAVLLALAKAHIALSNSTTPKGAYEPAEALLEKMLTVSPHNEQALPLLLEILLEQQKFGKITALLEPLGSKKRTKRLNSLLNVDERRAERQRANDVAYQIGELVRAGNIAEAICFLGESLFNAGVSRSGGWL